jgi:diadenosine tetraphosphate (Ap4A) HIT family hydrolase
MFAFWRESMAVARALSSLLEPRKMNYEIHGNSIPHLHLHLYPRFPGDPFEGRPIAMDAPAFTRTADDLRRMADALAAVGRGTSQTA